MAEPAAPAAPADPRRLRILCGVAGVMALGLGLYLFGPMWPGTAGRLQVATWESWGWAGPAEVDVQATPKRAWITLRDAGRADAPVIEGQGRVRARLSGGVYHCTVRMDGYTEQSFELSCAPDARVARRITLEPKR